jgi:hypothetical protein
MIYIGDDTGMGFLLCLTLKNLGFVIEIFYLSEYRANSCG